MSIPENPENPGPFGVQHGYKDLKVQTHKYSDKPTPIAGQQGKAEEFFYSKTDREHQKKYGKKIFQMILNAACR